MIKLIRCIFTTSNNVIRKYDYVSKINGMNMKQLVALIIILITSYHLSAQFEELTFGSDSTLDVITWNIEHFPKNGQITINYVSQIIKALDVDVIAVQEVTDNVFLDQLVESLEGWDGVYAYNQYAALAYIYKTDIIEEVDIYEIYTNNSREFPRSPLVMEMDYKDEHYIIINNHLKCCGDGYLDNDNPWDEEKRRLDACNLLDQYIIDNYPNEKVILLGDLNDILTDSFSNNVFQAFLSNTDDYFFADMEIAEGSSSNWSYPSWPSHLDHQLITNELFDEFGNEGSEIQTIRVDDYFEDGWYDYDRNVSDHRPVGIKINTDSNLGVGDISESRVNLSCFPNPVRTITTISFNPYKGKTEIEIYNATEQKVQHTNVSNNQSSVLLSVDSFDAGVYFVKLIVNGRVLATRKMIVLN